MNPFFLGVFFHWLGGLASASFYIPYRGVKKWSWETYWLVGGVFSWLIAPLVFASIFIPNLWEVLWAGYQASPKVEIPILWEALSASDKDSPKVIMTPIPWAYVFGAMWGLGGLTFGLTMRYLGIALGMAVALGFCAAFGTLVPPIFDGTIWTIIHETSGQVMLFGVACCLAGIAITGMAGMSKEGELSEEQKKETVKEFSFFKGILVATFSGIMSAAFAYGLAAGKPIGEVAKTALEAAGGNDIWQNLPVLIVVLWGGFTTNFIWCVLLNIKNGSGGEYLAAFTTADKDDPSKDVAVGQEQPSKTVRVPLLANYFFSALAGVTWYLQFFFYSMGETRMGEYGFSSWTLHMASIIIFSSLWGIALKEWKGTSRRTHVLLLIGLIVLIGSTVIVGYGNSLNVTP